MRAISHSWWMAVQTPRVGPAGSPNPMMTASSAASSSSGSGPSTIRRFRTRCRNASPAMSACWSLARARGGDPLAASKIRAKSPGRTRLIGVWSGSEADMLGTLRFDSGSRPGTASHDLVDAGADWQPPAKSATQRVFLDRPDISTRSRARTILEGAVIKMRAVPPNSGVRASMTTVSGSSVASLSTSTILGALDAEALERRTRQIGRELFERIGHWPSPWHRAWWDDRLMNWSLNDPQVRVQLFRFIDALPSLRSADSVRRHLAEYLAEAGEHVPWWLKLAVALAPAGSDRETLLAWSARSAAEVMARKFIAGATPDQATRTVLGLRDKSLAFTADLLGEAVISDAEADLYQQTCLDLIGGLADPLKKAPEVPLIDRDQNGPIPRVNLSLKLSSLTTHFDPIHAEATLMSVAGRLRPILRTARELSAYVHVDMEQYSYRALTYALFRRILAEPELRALLEWVESRGTPITIRLVKGAYWDYEVLTARRLGWPEPVFLQKWQSDAMFERCTRFLIEHHDKLRPAFGSHNIRSLAHAIAAAETAELAPAGFELQTLHGMGDVIQAALVACGHRVRVYTPYGAMLPGMAYLVRRLLENTSNESFLKASFAEHAQIENLLRNPEEVGAMVSRTRRTISQSAPRAAELTPFRNEPVTDFAIAENRQAMTSAIEEVRQKLGQTYPLLIAGQEIRGNLRLLDSSDPSRSSRIVS